MLAAGDDHTTAPEPADPLLPWRVYQIMQRHCVDCHGGHMKRPKGDFGYVLDLKRMAKNPDLVVPGAAMDSELYILMIEEPEFLMPPPDSDVPPVPEADIALVKHWINLGALTTIPDVEAVMAADAVANAAEPTTPSKVQEPLEPVGQRVAAATQPNISPKEIDHDESPVALGAEARQLFGKIHPMIVHFPIALIIVAFFAEALLACRPMMVWLAGATRLCLWTGALGGIAAAATGWVNVGVQGYSPDSVFAHRWLGVGTVITSLLLLGLFEWANRSKNPSARKVILICLALVAITVGITGHTGGELVYGEGYPFAN